MNFLRKAQLYFAYRRVVRENREPLFSRHNIKVDTLGRLYTIFSVPESDLATYGKDFPAIALKSYITKVDTYLSSLGLAELYGKLEEERLNDNQYRVVIGYRFFNVEKIANRLLTIASYIGIGFIAAVFIAIFYFLGRSLNFL